MLSITELQKKLDHSGFLVIGKTHIGLYCFGLSFQIITGNTTAKGPKIVGLTYFPPLLMVKGQEDKLLNVS